MATAGKVSPSGIAVSDDCVALYNDLKIRSTHKWVTFKIDGPPTTTVVVDHQGPPESSFAEFVAAFPGDACRYGVYDFLHTKPGNGGTSQKLVFVFWAPETAGVRSKVMYASTKDFFRELLSGLSADLQVSDATELTEAEVNDHISKS